MPTLVGFIYHGFRCFVIHPPDGMVSIFSPRPPRLSLSWPPSTMCAATRPLACHIAL